jgi:D-methionine transport system permease protein
MLNASTTEILLASGQTLYMIFLSTLGAIILGWPLGTFIYIFEDLAPRPKIAKTLNFLINTVRSIPFIIFMVTLLPLTRWLVGTAIGLQAALVPLTLGATPFFARLVIQAYQQISPGIIEYGLSIGASPWQMVRNMLIQESLPFLIDAITLTSITLVSYSALAGAIGGGGLGDLAIRYGYQRFDTLTMLITTAILVIMVQSLQWLGSHIKKYLMQTTTK